MKKILCVIDCQNDFITGSLRNEEAIKVVPNIVKKIDEFNGDKIFVTLDSHSENYLESKEGKKLPFVHCVFHTDGWHIEKSIHDALSRANGRGIKVNFYQKSTFGSEMLMDALKRHTDDLEIEFVGFCTDICVVSNALMAKAACYHTADIRVDASCCAGTSIDAHNAALKVMNSCQIDII